MGLLRVLAAAVVCVCFQAGVALADDPAGQLAGSWKLTSWTIQIIGGEASEPFGPNPKGRAIFAADGYVTIEVLSGELRMSTAEHEYRMPSRSLLVLRPGVRHDVRAEAPSRMLLTVRLDPAEDERP